MQSGVFAHSQIAGDQGGEAGAPGLAQQQGGLRIDIDKNNLHRGSVWLVAPHHFTYAFVKHFESGRQTGLHHVRRFDGAAGHIAQRLAFDINHAKAGDLQARVNAQYAHAAAHGRSTLPMRATMALARVAR